MVGPNDISNPKPTLLRKLKAAANLGLEENMPKNQKAIP